MELGGIMKITRTIKDIENYNKSKEDANLECNICPCCKSKIVTHLITRTKLKGLIFRRLYNYDEYMCLNCLSRWESDGYKVSK